MAYETIVYLPHAWRQMSVRKIGEIQVRRTIAEPDRLYPSRSHPERLVAERVNASGNTIRVVFEVQEGGAVALVIAAIRNREEVAMVLRYNPDRHLLYVALRDGEVVETAELDDETSVDFDADGRPVGIEFLDASAFFPFLQRLLPDTTGVMMEVPATLRDLLDRRFGVAPEDGAVVGLVRQPGVTAGAAGA